MRQQGVEGLTSHILLALVPPGLCARERSPSWPYNLARLVHSATVEIGVTKGYVGLALLKQIGVLDDPSTVCPYPGHVWFVRRTANLNHSDGRNKG